MKKKHILLSLLSTLFLIILCFVIGLKLFFLDSRMVTSGSMSNTLLHGDYIISRRLDFTNRNDNPGLPARTGLQRQDIVLLKLPGEREVLIKRIIGLPGDTVEFTGQGVAVNGQLLAEPYADSFPGYSAVPFYRVQAGELFVLGDNRQASRDSRVFGAVGIGCIKGKVLLRYYPFARFRFF